MKAALHSSRSPFMKLCRYFHIGLHFFENFKRIQTLLFCLKFSVEIRMCADYSISALKPAHVSLLPLFRKHIFPTLGLQKILMHFLCQTSLGFTMKEETSLSMSAVESLIGVLFDSSSWPPGEFWSQCYCKARIHF